MDMILKTTVLCKSFKGQMAVNNVSLNIQRNSIYGLLGPNGAGKSTILKMITGILRPTSGAIEFDGHPWSRADLENIGALIEMPPLYENLGAMGPFLPVYSLVVSLAPPLGNMCSVQWLAASIHFCICQALAKTLGRQLYL